ncbi:MAG: N-acetylneuraminate synthase [Candidatus Dadabacteria bacterium]|nr:N-acetylneuraminate synthase [Candidatus Dadabacteria bacterium]
MQEIDINGRRIGAGRPCFVIAEAGVNHNGDVASAKRLVGEAKKAGADAVKFQTFKSEKVVSRSAPKADYQKKTTDPYETQLEMIRRLELSFDDFRVIKDECDRRGILFLSSPFDESSVDLLDDLDIPAFKVASGEITNHPFLEYIGKRKKPVILSTGMSYLEEVQEACRVVQDSGCEELVLLHCVTNYPARAADVNLGVLDTMRAAFQVPIGYSDHTLGIEVPLAAVALGACVIEKHFTLDKNMPGPDHRASLEPDELARMIEAIGLVQAALGDGIKRPTGVEMANRIAGRRSVAAARTIKSGSVITREMLTALRPGDGIPPKEMSLVIGRKARHDIETGQLITLDMVE